MLRSHIIDVAGSHILDVLVAESEHAARCVKFTKAGVCRAMLGAAIELINVSCLTKNMLTLRITFADAVAELAVAEATAHNRWMDMHQLLSSPSSE